MAAPSDISVLLLDIGGVLLTNGWDRRMRRQAAEKFELDWEEMDERHHLTFDTYEEGKLSLDTYLDRLVFYTPRPFSKQEFKAFMFGQSKPYPETIKAMRELAARYNLHVGAVSNEGRELTTYRIGAFKLTDFIQFFVCSCFVHYRKPDEDIYRIALDIAQASPGEAVYVDDRQMFVEVAAGLGIRGIHHTDLKKTCAELAKLGLVAG